MNISSVLLLNGLVGETMPSATSATWGTCPGLTHVKCDCNSRISESGSATNLMALTRSLITFERRARRTTTLFSARVRLLLLCGLAFARSPASGAPGELDTTFGTGGIVITDFGSRARCYGLAVQRDGKIVVAGWASNGSNRDFALARYTANGALDPSFVTNGKVTTAIGNSDELAFDVVVQSDGKIVAAGWSSNR